MNIHPTHSETYWEVVLVDTMFKRCENDLLDWSGRKKLSMCMNIHECSSWRWRRGCRGVLAELCEDVCMYSTSCTVVTLGAIRLRSILTDRPVPMLSESGWNAIQVCYAIKKERERPPPVTFNSSVSCLAKGDFTLAVHPELCSYLTRSWAGNSSGRFLWRHVLSSVVSFFFYRCPHFFVLWLTLF